MPEDDIRNASPDSLPYFDAGGSGVSEWCARLDSRFLYQFV